MSASGERRRGHCGTKALVRIAATYGLAVLIFASSAPVHARGAGSTGSTPCKRADLSVQAPGEYTVAGTLCRRHRGTKRILLITSHGATYNRLYWDWPQNRDVYSFRKNVVTRRVSVLNLDLLGSGGSTHPFSGYLTHEAQASMLHQVVGAMRAREFKKIILIGHSSGSGTATLEAATYHDVDGLIVTGMLHAGPSSALGLLSSLPLSLYPAALDPAFAGMDLDAGYETTRPGTRGQPALYNTEVADPAVIAYDDAHKDVVTLPQALGFAAIFTDDSISQAVDAPVLSLVGAYDGFCGSPSCPEAADEASAWSPAADLKLHVIPEAGHDIHLHGDPYATTEFAHVRNWLTSRFTTKPSKPPG
jgi:pimeloyl-ACP methyl ester carboxylesterase